MVERSEYRHHGAQAVGMLTAHMENKDYASFVRWLAKLSRSTKVPIALPLVVIFHGKRKSGWIFLQQRNRQLIKCVVTTSIHLRLLLNVAGISVITGGGCIRSEKPLMQ